MNPNQLNTPLLGVAQHPDKDIFLASPYKSLKVAFQQLAQPFNLTVLT